MNLIREQYQLIRRTRESLFSYCEALPHDDYVRQLEGFGNKSMRDLHVHIADCYEHWMARRGLGRTGTIDLSMPDRAQTIRKVFDQVDDMVEQFFTTYSEKWLTMMEVAVPWQEEPLVVTPLWLLTHPITHEFHHKGQMVAMGRQMGHTPPDTDLLP